MGFHRTRGGHEPRNRPNGPSGQPTGTTLWLSGTTFPWNLLKLGGNVKEGARRNILESLRWYIGERCTPSLPPQCELHFQRVGIDLWHL
jgi:hypothetical protein